jgi:phospholipid/cholesterol/gamma-HCH transport system ATP-binding protein
MELIRVTDIHKSYGSKKVHRGLSFSLFTGECLGLIGGSGSGKSVILRTLIGLERPDQGQIHVDGIEVTGLSENELVPVRKRVAYAFQGGALFDSMTVYENLAYPLREHTKLQEPEIRKKITDLLAEFGLAGNEAIYPGNLSGGMQKRVGLARAIILQPEVVLYDEPTAGLDPHNTLRIQEMILRLKGRGVSSILVTHDMPTAFAVCDRLIMLKGGLIVEQGDTATLQNKKTGFIQSFIKGEEP